MEILRTENMLLFDLQNSNWKIPFGGIRMTRFRIEAFFHETMKKNSTAMSRRGLSPLAHEEIPIKNYDQSNEDKEMIVPFLWSNAIRVIKGICDHLYPVHMPSNNNHCSHTICQRSHITLGYQNCYY